MRSIIFLAPVLTAGIAMASPAAAQDFTGPRLEANIAYDRLGADGDFGDEDKLDGARTGITAGYDLAVSPTIVIGAEAGIGWTTGEVSAALPQNARASVRFGRDIELLGRVGVRVGARTLAYAKAGYANSRYRGRYTSVQNGATFSAEGDVDELRIGAGVEQSLGRRTFVKGEYRFTTDMDRYTTAGSRHQLMLGAGVRF